MPAPRSTLLRAPSPAHVRLVQTTGVFIGWHCEGAHAVTRYRLPTGIADLYYGRDHLVPEYLRFWDDGEGAAGA